MSAIYPAGWKSVLPVRFLLTVTVIFQEILKKILTKYFDAMLYLANWGSRQLVFRLPKSLVDPDQIRPYCKDGYISLSVVNKYFILNIEFHEEECGFWIEGEGWLSSLACLRDDILKGDYRLLYLAWLKAITMEEMEENISEPPVPPGLRKLSRPLRDFAELFEIEDHLIRAAAKKSADRKPPADDKLLQAIRKLPREECNTFLLRLARGEAHLSVEINKRLSELVSRPRTKHQEHRTVKQLFEDSNQEWEQEQQKKAEKAEAERIRALEALAQKEPRVWKNIDELIQKSKAKAYDEAVRLLLQLRELAVYQGRRSVFQERLNRIHEQYRRRSTLIMRLNKVNLNSV